MNNNITYLDPKCLFLNNNNNNFKKQKQTTNNNYKKTTKKNNQKNTAHLKSHQKTPTYSIYKVS